MLFGERPYWWIGESRLFVGVQPKLHQFPCTCETGPGERPSKPNEMKPAALLIQHRQSSKAGVCVSLRESIRTRHGDGSRLVGGGVLAQVISVLSDSQVNKTKPEPCVWLTDLTATTVSVFSLLMSAAPCLLYGLVLVAVGLSRIFVLAHFPHQVVAGCITGPKQNDGNNHMKRISQLMLLILSRVYFRGCSEPTSTRRTSPAVLLQPQPRPVAQCCGAPCGAAATWNQPLMVNCFYQITLFYGSVLFTISLVSCLYFYVLFIYIFF